MTLYKLNLTPQERKEIGFQYDENLDTYVYEFPVYRFRNKALLVCKINIEDETNLVIANVYNKSTKELYSAYYNRTFGKSKVVEKIDQCIIEKLKSLGAEEVSE